MSQTLPLAPADRLALIIEGLCQALVRRVGVRGIGGLPGPFLLLIWNRLRGITVRFAASVARHAANPFPIPFRLRGPRPARHSQPRLLPRGKAWLLRLIPETASGASQLRYFLADPEVASLLAAAPKLQSILNPLCHMLGIRAAGIRAVQVLSLQAPHPPASPMPAAPTPEVAFFHCPIPSQAPPQAAFAVAPPAVFPPWPPPPSPYGASLALA